MIHKPYEQEEKVVRKYTEEVYNYFVNLGIEGHLERLNLNPDTMTDMIGIDTENFYGVLSEYSSGPSIKEITLFNLIKKYPNVLEHTQYEPKQFNDDRIILYPIFFEKEEKSRIEILEHEFWHVVEEKSKMIDSISEGTAMFIMPIIQNSCKQLIRYGVEKEIEEEDRVINKFNDFVYQWGLYKVLEKNPTPTDLLGSKELRKEIEDEFLNDFEEFFNPEKDIPYILHSLYNY